MFSIVYESLLAAGSMAENRVLELKLGDLKHSNDSLVQEILKSKEPLKIKDKQLKQLLSVSTAINDTTDASITRFS